MVCPRFPGKRPKEDQILGLQFPKSVIFLLCQCLQYCDHAFKISKNITHLCIIVVYVVGIDSENSDERQFILNSVILQYDYALFSVAYLYHSENIYYLYVGDKSFIRSTENMWCAQRIEKSFP